MTAAPRRVLLSLLLLLARPAAGADQPSAVVQYRQNVMKSLGSHMRALAALSKGEVSFPEQAGVHAAAVSALSPLIPLLFPPGTGPDHAKTGARSEAWSDEKGFKAAAAHLDVEAKKLATLAAGHDRGATRAQLEAVNKACTACHQSYRLKDW